MIEISVFCARSEQQSLSSPKPTDRRRHMEDIRQDRHLGIHSAERPRFDTWAQVLAVDTDRRSDRPAYPNSKETQTLEAAKVVSSPGIVGMPKQGIHCRLNT